LDIVLINSLNPFGNYHLIPRGILREPLSSLKRADIFVLTKTNLVDDVSELVNKLKKLNHQALVVEAVHEPVYLSSLNGEKFELSQIKDREVCLLSAIADTYSFKRLVLSLGAKVKLKFEFPDHHHWQREEIEKILDSCKQQEIDTIVTTKKDSVRLRSFSFSRLKQLFILNMELRITKNEEEFFRRLYSL
jgi:tetraacyldisaccharide 4'-kinase